MTIKETLAALLRFKTVQPLEAHKALRAEIAENTHHVNRLVMVPPTREDVKAAIGKRVAAMAAQFEHEMAERIKPFTLDGRALENPRLVEQFMTFAGGDDAPLAGIERALCAALPDLMVKTLHATVDRMTWPDKAMPLAESRRQIAQLERRNAQLLIDEAELETAIHDAGLRF